MSALLGFFLTKDGLYVSIIAALLAIFGWYTYHERALGAASELAAVSAASNRARAAAAAQVTATTNAYNAAITAEKTSHANDLAAAAASSDALSRRLRDYETNHRCPNPVLGSAVSSTPGGVAAPGSVESALGQLIGAAEHDLAVIAAERAERDALTGK